MELLLLIVVIAGFVTNLLALRFFLKQISDKIEFNSPLSDEVDPLTKNSDGAPPMVAIPRNQKMPYTLPVDKPSANQITDDENDFEVNEQNIGTLPTNIKLEVEGGDGQVPPEYEGGVK